MGNHLRKPARQFVLIGDGGDPITQMVSDLGAVVLDRAASPLVEPKIRGVDTELSGDEHSDLVRHIRTPSWKPTVAAVVLQQHREAQRRRATPPGK